MWLVDDYDLEIGYFIIYRAHDVADKDGGFCYLSYPSMIDFCNTRAVDLFPTPLKRKEREREK